MNWEKIWGFSLLALGIVDMVTLHPFFGFIEIIGGAFLLGIA